MAASVGVDTVSIERMAALIARRPRFVEREFSETERRRSGRKPERYASRWAAKEAVRKLYGVQGRKLPGYRAIEVVNVPGGAPKVRVDGTDTDISISLTHDAGIAIAVAVSGGSAPSFRCVLPPPAGLHLPPRPKDAHKGTFGTVVVLGAARGTAGAAVLSGMGALRAGAGLVRVCVPESVYSVVAAQCLEVMAHALPGDVFGADGARQFREKHLPIADAMVIGPGLGTADETKNALLALLPEISCPTVVDADALNIAAAANFNWRTCPAPVIVTPHPGEMARLINSDTKTVQSHREKSALEFAKQQNVTVILKGAGTMIAAPDGRIHTDLHQTPALASGGTGDVLAGVCGAMLAAGLETFEAAVAAVTIHAEAGCLVEMMRGRAGGLARDLLEMLPVAQESLRRAMESSA